MKFRIQHFPELPSTNTLALEYAGQGVAEGLVIVTDHQTNGRGKPGRKWVSPPGKNLLFSVLLRPPIPPSRAPLITQIACRSVAHILENHYQIPCTFKRPNDIMVNGKKICGVLVEAQSTSSGKLESVVIGIGLNVNAGVKELLPTATSIKELMGQDISKDEILHEILGQLKSDIKELYGHIVGCR